MSTNTLTSLAILKVNIDQGKDYLDYLRPFILQVLLEHNPDPITSKAVSEHIREQFGLEIPERTVDIVLRRISRDHPIKNVGGVYRKTGDLPDPQIGPKQADAERHIGAVLHALRQFSQRTINPIGNDDAIEATCAFLSEFNITCLRSYLRGTVIPELENNHQRDIVLVSDFVQYVQRADPETFNSFILLVQGHMLANALTCPDLQNAPKSYNDVTFYLDTPLLVRALGCEGKAKQEAVRELIALVRKLGGTIATFAHSQDELRRVLNGAALYLESPDGRGAVVFESRRRGVTKSDLLLLAESVDNELSAAGIEVDATPRYIEQLQIDETVFEQVLEDGVSYYNPRAKEYDINSVRSVYVIRGNMPAISLEKARAVFVTSNAAFANAAWEYGRQYESSQEVSSVITDFSLANLAWLKAPIGAPLIPTTQLLAFSYAALEPSRELLVKYLAEVDRLEARGTITERDHQLLRSSPLAYPELVHLTLGEDSALTTETITETLERVSNEIKKEESEKLTAEQSAHQETIDAYYSQRSQSQQIVSNLYWRCHGKARNWAWVISGGMATILTIGLLSPGIGLLPTAPIASWVLIGASLVLALLTLINLVFGSTVRDFHVWLQNRLLDWMLKRESKVVGIDLSDIIND